MISRESGRDSHAQTRVRRSVVNLSLRMLWRRVRNFAKAGRGCSNRESCHVARSVEFPVLPFHRLCVGGRARQRLSGDGGAAGGIRAAGGRRAPKTFAAVPFLVFAAP